MTSLWRQFLSNHNAPMGDCGGGDDVSNSKLSRSWGQKGHGIGQFNMPTGVCVTKQGHIIVVDTENSRLQMFSCHGDFLHVIASAGKLPHQLCYPLCVTTWCEGDLEVVAVTDGVHASVKMFQIPQQQSSMCPSFITCFGQDVLAYPSGIATTSCRDIVVSDLTLHAVFMFTSQREPLRSFGGNDQDQLLLDMPYFVAVDKQDQIIISDTGDTSIKVFSQQGTLQRCFRQNDFRLPQENCIILHGITVDDHGHVIIVANNTIYIAAKDGRFWEVLVPDDGLYAPRGVAFTKSSLVVTQYDLHTTNHRVDIYRYHQHHFNSLLSIPSTNCTALKKKARRIVVKRTRSHVTSSSSESDTTHL